jgi:hypothetical protein
MGGSTSSSSNQKFSTEHRFGITEFVYFMLKVIFDPTL